jgi:prophage regulatory protein
MIKRYLRLPQVLERIPVSRSTWWAGVKKGIFPKSIKLSPRVTVWREEDIDNLGAKDEIEQSKEIQTR